VTTMTGEGQHPEPTTRDLEREVLERLEKPVLHRIIKVGVANSRSGTPIAMPARTRVVRLPKPEECEEIPAMAIDKGDRLITNPERKSKLGGYIEVQEVEVQKLDGKAINVTVLARAPQAGGLQTRMQMDPLTAVRRF